MCCNGTGSADKPIEISHEASILARVKLLTPQLPLEDRLNKLVWFEFESFQDRIYVDIPKLTNKSSKAPKIESSQSPASFSAQSPITSTVQPKVPSLLRPATTQTHQDTTTCVSRLQTDNSETQQTHPNSIKSTSNSEIGKSETQRDFKAKEKMKNELGRKALEDLKRQQKLKELNRSENAGWKILADDNEKSEEDLKPTRTERRSRETRASDWKSQILRHPQVPKSTNVEQEDLGKGKKDNEKEERRPIFGQEESSERPGENLDLESTSKQQQRLDTANLDDVRLELEECRRIVTGNRRRLSKFDDKFVAFVGQLCAKAERSTPDSLDREEEATKSTSHQRNQPSNAQGMHHPTSIVKNESFHDCVSHMASNNQHHTLGMPNQRNLEQSIVSTSFQRSQMSQSSRLQLPIQERAPNTISKEFAIQEGSISRSPQRNEWKISKIEKATVDESQFERR
ncbi:hypothetical protein HK098_001900 [Nowakowskiella sp. JEL0407]|nr:hypothetical protein HK098_001900 [Nowakowskiella sp. JEL0407]